MIYKKILLALPLVSILLVSGYPPSIALGSGYSQYENLNFDTSYINPVSVRKEADEYFVKAFDSATEEDQTKYYQYAMQKYYLLSIAEPYNYYPYVQMARIHD